MNKYTLEDLMNTLPKKNILINIKTSNTSIYDGLIEEFKIKDFDSIEKVIVKEVYPSLTGSEDDPFSILIITLDYKVVFNK